MDDRDATLEMLAQVTGLGPKELERILGPHNPAPALAAERSGVTPGGIVWRG